MPEEYSVSQAEVNFILKGGTRPLRNFNASVSSSAVPAAQHAAAGVDADVGRGQNEGNKDVDDEDDHPYQERNAGGTGQASEPAGRGLSGGASVGLHQSVTVGTRDVAEPSGQARLPIKGPEWAVDGEGFLPYPKRLAGAGWPAQTGRLDPATGEVASGDSTGVRCGPVWTSAAKRGTGTGSPALAGARGSTLLSLPLLAAGGWSNLFSEARHGTGLLAAREDQGAKPSGRAGPPRRDQGRVASMDRRVSWGVKEAEDLISSSDGLDDAIGTGADGDDSDGRAGPAAVDWRSAAAAAVVAAAAAASGDRGGDGLGGEGGAFCSLSRDSRSLSRVGSSGAQGVANVSIAGECGGAVQPQAGAPWLIGNMAVAAAGQAKDQQRQQPGVEPVTWLQPSAGVSGRDKVALGTAQHPPLPALQKALPKQPQAPSPAPTPQSHPQPPLGLPEFESPAIVQQTRSEHSHRVLQDQQSQPQWPLLQQRPQHQWEVGVGTVSAHIITSRGGARLPIVGVGVKDARFPIHGRDLPFAGPAAGNAAGSGALQGPDETCSQMPPPRSSSLLQRPRDHLLPPPLDLSRQGSESAGLTPSVRSRLEIAGNKASLPYDRDRMAGTEGGGLIFPMAPVRPYVTGGLPTEPGDLMHDKGGGERVEYAGEPFSPENDGAPAGSFHALMAARAEAAVALSGAEHHEGDNSSARIASRISGDGMAMEAAFSLVGEDVSVGRETVGGGANSVLARNNGARGAEGGGEPFSLTGSVNLSRLLDDAMFQLTEQEQEHFQRLQRGIPGAVSPMLNPNEISRRQEGQQQEEELGLEKLLYYKDQDNEEQQEQQLQQLDQPTPAAPVRQTAAPNDRNTTPGLHPQQEGQQYQDYTYEWQQQQQQHYDTGSGGFEQHDDLAPPSGAARTLSLPYAMPPANMIAAAASTDEGRMRRVSSQPGPSAMSLDEGLPGSWHNPGDLNPTVLHHQGQIAPPSPFFRPPPVLGHPHPARPAALPGMLATVSSLGSIESTGGGTGSPHIRGPTTGMAVGTPNSGSASGGGVSVGARSSRLLTSKASLDAATVAAIFGGQ